MFERTASLIIYFRPVRSLGDRMSIQSKFSLLVLGLLLLAVVAVTGISVSQQTQALQQQAVLRGRALAKNLAAASQDALLTGDPLTLVNLAVGAREEGGDVVYAAIVDSKGVTRGHSQREALGKPFSLDTPSEVAGFGQDVRRSGKGKDEAWDVSAPVLARGRASLGEAHVAMSASAVSRTVRQALVRLLVAAAVLLLLGALLSVLSVGVMVKPLRALAEAASKVGAGDLTQRVPVASQDEIGALMSTFNQMVEGLGQAQSAKLEQERMRGELDVARNIQAGLLPSDPPKLKGVDVSFYCAPAKELGGDFYDWFPLDGGKLGLVIADVSGKGVPAALHMANLRNLFRFVVKDSSGAVDTLRKVNMHAWPDLKGESFVTVIYAVLDPAKGKLNMVSAGHEPVLIVRASGKVEELRGKGMPIGVAEPEDFDVIVKEVSVDLQKGDRLVLYTDGVTEAMNAQQVQFGRAALEKAIAGAKSVADTQKRLLDAVQAHANGFEQSDDLTLLVVGLT